MKAPTSDQAVYNARLLATLLGCSLTLMIPAFYNGFPFIEGDTGPYLSYGLTLAVNWDRPFFYGLFAIPFHLKYSLWPLAFVQGLLAAHLLYLLVRATLPKHTLKLLVLFVVILTATSSLPWQTGQIMPDGFTALVILVYFLTGFCVDRLGRWELVYLVLLNSMFISFHYSHIALAIGLAVTVLAIRMVVGARNWLSFRALFVLLCPIVLALAASLTVNLVRNGEAVTSTGSSIYFLARVIADGPARLYLDDVCGQKHYAICKYKDELTDRHDDFLWGPHAVRRKVRDDVGQAQLRKEASEIALRSILAYPKLQLTKFASNTFEQLIRFATAEDLDSLADADSPTNATIREIFGSGVYDAYSASRQQTETLPLDRISAFDNVVIYVTAALFVLVFVMLLKRNDRNLVSLYVLVLAGMLGNAFISGALAGPHDRYQARVIWLLVLCLLVGISSIGQGRGQFETNIGA